MNKDNLILENMKLVYYLISKYYPTFIGDEDLQQVGMLGLCKAANTWNEEKSKFSTYASKCILNEINFEFKRRKKHNGVLSLDKELGVEDGAMKTFGDLIVGEDDVGFVDYKGFLATLSDRQKDVLELSERGFDTDDIADMLDVSTQSVNASKRQIKLKWRKYNGD
jgi:RNA polymerase sporulation-specific sigma factor